MRRFYFGKKKSIFLARTCQVNNYEDQNISIMPFPTFIIIFTSVPTDH